DEVVDQGRAMPTDTAWTLRLKAALPGVRVGAVAGSDVMVATAAAKAALRTATGAVAADMESHVVARAAERHRLPFAVARTISDAAHRGLPASAQAGMKPDGGMDLPGVLAALARRPWELPALIRTGVEAEAAFAALLRGRQLLGGTLGGPGPGADLG
ncbi:MAG: phosphorylase, partial [Methylobacteriaceae bacterium]|nr:phosphorylase [Methylobacteriaceae bacterium]